MTGHQTSQGLITGIQDVPHQVQRDEHTTRHRRGQPAAAGSPMSPIQPRPAQERGASQ